LISTDEAVIQSFTDILDFIQVGSDSNQTPCAGFLVDGRLKELLPPLPVIYVKAVPVQPSWEPSAVGE
jgi:dynein heavy chain